MEHTDAVSVVQSVQMLQDAPRDTVLVKQEEEFLFEDGGEGCF